LEEKRRVETLTDVTIVRTACDVTSDVGGCEF